jgi:hypothetical protein
MGSTARQDGSSAESYADLNGRTPPMERVEEKVLRDDERGRLVERVIRPYDQTGNPGPEQRVRIEETKNADGSTNSLTTVHRRDLNGSYVLAERTRREASRLGDVETATVTVERPSGENRLEVAERREATTRRGEKRTEEEVVTWRRDQSGRFTQAVRKVSERTESDGRVSEDTREYIAGEGGKLQFNGRVVSESEKLADGSETQQVSVYGAGATGRPQEGTPQLREQQLIERRPGPDKSLTETFSIRRPALDNPNAVGAYQKISERVCTGDCLKK